jgi:hypothetical protein
MKFVLLAAAILTQQPNQMPCGSRAGLVKELHDKFKENINSIGITGSGTVMELFTSESGSWTLLVTMPNGNSCLIASGSGWESIKTIPGKDI